MGALRTLRNIGVEMERKLNSVGISTPEELSNSGSRAAFAKLKTAHPNVCTVHLYTLQAAIDDIDLNQLPEQTKAELKAFSDSIGTDQPPHPHP